MKPILFPSQIFPRSFQNPLYQSNQFSNMGNDKNLKEIMQNKELSLNEVTPKATGDTVFDKLKKEYTDVKTDTSKIEDILVEKLEDYLRKSENKFSQERNELVKLINDSVNDKYSTISNQLQEIVKLNTQPTFTPQIYHHQIPNLNYMQQTYPPQSDAKVVQQQSESVCDSETKMVVCEKKEKIRKGKYYKLTKNLWNDVCKQYPDLTDDLFESAFIRDDEKFVKIKNNYIKISDSGVAKILSLIKH